MGPTKILFPFTPVLDALFALRHFVVEDENL